MKSKSLMLFVVAGGCGLVAMVGAQQWLANNQGPKADMVKVLVARVEIDSGVRLTPEMVGFKDFPKQNVPEGAVVKEEQYTERALKSRAYPGQPILVAQLGEKGQYGTSMEIPEGIRLATLKVDPTMIHSGIMKPGDRVDVVLTYTVQRRGSQPDTRTRTILQYIQVYAMGNHTMSNEPIEMDAPAKDVKGVSLLVTPVQAELLKYAENKGTLHLTLRSTLDKAPVMSEGADAAQLEKLQTELFEEMNDTPKQTHEVADNSSPRAATFADFVKEQPAGPAPAAAPKATWKVEVYQSGDKKTYEFEIEEDETQPSSAAASAAAAPTADLLSPLAQWFFGNARTKTAQVAP
jgi:pilus assembly protein CpaB